MIRPETSRDPRLGPSRRRMLRLGLLGGSGFACAELFASVVPFMRVQRVVGLGVPVPVGKREEILDRFRATDDRPILFAAGKFFLLHAPGGIVAAYRKCTHLGCSVPFDAAEDRFHCPCHQSVYDKRTAVVISGPAPKPLQLFHITTQEGTLVVDTNPLSVIDRRANAWDPAVLEVSE
ncbi:MAG: Rieske 2Fe-2S domain-containing protein [Chloroflexota bacterium]|nr:Rieske 2Fe-2S domain-containing protein [Chloroflexota bacterium]